MPTPLNWSDVKQPSPELLQPDDDVHSICHLVHHVGKSTGQQRLTQATIAELVPKRRSLLYACRRAFYFYFYLFLLIVPVCGQEYGSALRSIG